MRHLFALAACLGATIATIAVDGSPGSESFLASVSSYNGSTSCLGGDGIKVPIFDQREGLASGWQWSGQGGEQIETTAGDPLAVQGVGLKFVSPRPFCGDAVLDLVLQGDVIARASILFLSSELDVVSRPIPLWTAVPDAIVNRRTIGGILRVVFMEGDYFRVSVNIKAAVKNRGVTPVPQEMSWDTILLTDESGRGFTMRMQSAAILPNNPLPTIKDGSTDSCVGSVCNDALDDALDGRKLVPLFGFLDRIARDETALAVDIDDADRERYVESNTIIVNGRLPDEGFSRGRLLELCRAMAAASESLCRLDETAEMLALQDPAADVDWPLISIEVPSVDALNRVREIAYGHIRWVELNEVADTTAVSGSPEGWVPASNASAGTQCSGIPWGMNRIRRQDAPDGLSGRGVQIYVLDSGVSPNNHEFGDRVREGFNCVSGSCISGDTEDTIGHGTHVAGVIAGRCYGVAPEAEVVPIKVIGSDLRGGYNAVIAGIKQSIDRIEQERSSGGRGVINLSLGGPRSEALNEAVRQAVQRGVPVVVSAGNNGFSNACTLSPSSAGPSVCVSATNSLDEAAGFSNIGQCVDVWAPGMDVAAADFQDQEGYSVKSGTSQAAPHVAGVIALVMQGYPQLNPQEIAEVIYDAAETIDLAPETTQRFLSLTRLGDVLGRVLQSQFRQALLE